MSPPTALTLLLAAALTAGAQAPNIEKPAMKTDTRPSAATSTAPSTLQTATFALG